MYEVPGYTLAAAGIPHFSCRSEASGGAMGVAILVRDPMSARVIHSADDVCEPRFASITLANAGFAATDGELTVLCAYLPSLTENARQAYAALATYVEAVSLAGRSCVVAGDLNVHLHSEFGDALPHTVNEPKTHAFDDECSGLGITAVNGVAALVGNVAPATFNTATTHTTIDYIMVPTEALDCVSVCTVTCVDAPDSDHSAVITTVNADWGAHNRRRRQRPRPRFRYGILAPAGSADAEAVDVVAYHAQLNETLVPIAEEVTAAIAADTYTFASGPGPVNATLDRIVNEVRGSAYIHVGGRTLVASSKSWWTTECTAAKRNRDNARRLRDNAALNTPARVAAHAGYLRTRRKYQQVIRRARKSEHDHLRRLLLGTPVSSREWWRPFKGRKSSVGVPPVVGDDGAMATTAQAAAATLASDLETRCSSFPPDSQRRREKQDDIDAVGDSASPAVDAAITEGEVVELLTNIPTGKAAGIDNIPAELLRLPGTDNDDVTHAGIIAVVHALFELIRVTGCVPAMFKMSVVTCLYKGRPKDARAASSYRPISVSTALSKLFGTLLLNRMYDTLDSQLDYFCCGSRRGRDIQELILLTQHLLHQQTGSAVGVLYADVRAAYDTCDRTEILHSLLSAGVGGWVFRSIEDSLSGTHARVKVNGHLSDPVPIRNGLPQGCVYGPILFNIMFTGVMAAVNSVGRTATTPQLVPGAVCVSSATVLDDVAVFLSTDRTHRQLQLRRLEDFLTDIGMGLNPDKSQLLSRDPATLPSITVGGRVVPASKTVTYLGVELSLYGAAKNGKANWTPDGNRMMNCLRSGVFPYRYDNGLRRNTLSLPLALDVYRAQVLNPSTYACGVTLLTNKAVLKRLDYYAARGLGGILGTMWLCEPQLILAQVGILPAELTHMERRLRFLQRMAQSPGWMVEAYTKRAELAAVRYSWMEAVAESVNCIGLRDANGNGWPNLPTAITVPPPPNHPSWRAIVRHHTDDYADYVFCGNTRAGFNPATGREYSRLLEADADSVPRAARRAYIAAECYTPRSVRTKAHREPYLYLAPKVIARLLTQLRSCASTLAYDNHLIVSSVSPYCALCAATGAEVLETVPHFLFDCPVLATEAAVLVDKLEAALCVAAFSAVGLTMADVWAAFMNLTPERRAAVVLGGTLRDWDGYRLDFAIRAHRTRAGQSTLTHYSHAADRRESGATVGPGEPPNVLNWNSTLRGSNGRLDSAYTPNVPAFCYDPSEGELREFGAVVWPAVWSLWAARSQWLEALAATDA